jgi:hypothetical protein
LSNYVRGGQRLDVLAHPIRAQVVAEGKENSLEYDNAPRKGSVETSNVFQGAQGTLVSRHDEETFFGRGREDLGLPWVNVRDRCQLVEPGFAGLHCNGDRLGNFNQRVTGLWAEHLP